MEVSRRGIAENTRAKCPKYFQSLTYQTIKNEFNLVANMAVRACARVAANRKVAKQKGKPVKSFAPSSMDCDKDLFRFREQNWTVSLATIHGREQVELNAGNYQRGKLKCRNPTSAQLCKHRDQQFYLHIQIKDDAPDSPVADKVIGIDLGRRDIAVTSEGEKWDGTGIQSVRANSWAFYQLRMFIEYKALGAGVRVIPISPVYTSQMCSQCLHIHPVKGKSYRSGKTFKCGHCDWYGDADFNGANNIALVGRSINTPGGTGLSCKLSRAIEYVQLNLFDDFRATENPDFIDSKSW